MDIRQMIAAGYSPMVSRSCTGKIDKDGRPVEVFYWKKNRRS